MNFRISVSLLLWIWSIQLTGQESGLFRTSNCRTWYLPYNRTGDKADPCQQIILSMAREQYREPDQIRIGVPYGMSVSAIPAGNGISILTFRVETGIPQGSTRYRGFTVRDVLVPDECKLSFAWWKKSDSSATAITQYRKITFNDSAVAVLQVPILGFDPGIDSILPGKPEFHYSSRAAGKYFARIKLIQDYYASSALTDTLLVMGNAMRLDHPEKLPGSLVLVEEINRIVAVIGSRDFPGRLLAGENDTLDFTSRFRELFRLSKSVRYTFEERLDASGRIPFSGNTDSLCGLFVDRILFYVGLSQLVNGISGDIYRAYLDSCFTGNVFENDLDIVRRIAVRLYPDALPDTLLNYLSASLLRSFLTRADQLNREARHSEAFLLMSCAGIFASNNPYIRITDGADQVMAQAARGIYHSYLGIAESGLKYGRLGLAEEYLDKAETYRQSYPGIIAEDPVYQIMYRELLADRLAGCDRLLVAGHYLEALDCLDSLERSGGGKMSRFLGADLQSRREEGRTGMLEEAVKGAEAMFREGDPDSAVSRYGRARIMTREMAPDQELMARLDSLEMKVNRYNYSVCFGQGEQAYLRHNFREALNRFDSARYFAMKTGIESDPLLDTLSLQSLKNNLLEDIRTGQKLIWTNRLEEASAYAAGMREKVRKAGLENDQEIAWSLDLFSRKMGGQECRVVVDSFNVCMIRAEKVMNLGNFRKGVEIYRQVIKLSEDFPECSLMTLAVRDSLRRYEAAATYQQTYEEAETGIAAGQYFQAVEKLSSNEKLFRDKRLDRYGITQVTVYAYVKSRQNPMLTERAIGYYYGRSQYREAFRYLPVLREQGVNEKGVTALQQQLGHQLALEDRQADPSADPQRKLRQYLNKDSWFRAFSEAYLNAWK